MELKRYRYWRMFMWLNIAATIGVVALWFASCRWSYWIIPRYPFTADGRVLLARGAIIYTKFEWKGMLLGFAESEVVMRDGIIWRPEWENISNAKYDDFWIAIPLWMFAIPTLAGGALGYWRAKLTIPHSICRGCWYSLKGLPATATCPECGRSRSE